MADLGGQLQRRSRWKVIAVVGGAVLVVGVVLGAILFRDIQRIDPTSGGYDPPYDDFTGEPIDWLSHSHTETGFRDNGGWLLDTSLDCTTGQIRAHIGPVTFDFRKLSDRAIAIHKPHLACIARGFDPEWAYPESDLDAPEPADGRERSVATDDDRARRVPAGAGGLVARPALSMPMLEDPQGLASTAHA